MKQNGSAPKKVSLTNAQMAKCLEEVAELLEAQHANIYRVLAYRNAATTVRHLDQPVARILATNGLEGLIHLPGIGESIAHSLEQLVHTGKLYLLERLRGSTNPELVFMTVPTIGAELAHRIHEQLEIETLAELQTAVYDGRLAQVPGFGRKRLQAVRESLAGRLHPPTRFRKRSPAVKKQPPVAELLDVDKEYRQKANAKQLPRITPKRFNPTQEAWLPILHTRRRETQYTVLYSNTARAHQLDMIRDWVVIYRDDRNGSGQWTVTTSQFGNLRGRRIVRGREAACRTHYEQHKQVAPEPV